MSFRYAETKTVVPKKVNFSIDIAAFLFVLAGALVYMWAAGQLDLWRFGIAS